MLNKNDIIKINSIDGEKFYWIYDITTNDYGKLLISAYQLTKKLKLDQRKGQLKTKRTDFKTKTIYEEYVPHKVLTQTDIEKFELIKSNVKEEQIL
jgi:hypothetical protein